LPWRKADTAELTRFRPEGSAHRPRVQVRLLYDDAGLYGLFNVRDRYVRAVVTKYQGPVCTDSCVEFFVKPKKRSGYFNFEFNCGGALLVFYITDPARTKKGFKKFVKLPRKDGAQVRIFHTLPKTVDPEIAARKQWRLGFHIPFALLEKYAGPLGEPAGQSWTGNFYKCGDKTSHPHWVSWSPVTRLAFHLPECFGPLRFEK
jgi:hypothetical protein